MISAREPLSGLVLNLFDQSGHVELNLMWIGFVQLDCVCVQPAANWPLIQQAISVQQSQ